MTTSSFGYNGLDARVSKTDSTGTFSFKRNGAGVTDPVLSDGAATYTPGISERRAGSSKFLHSGMKNADAQSGASANVDSSRTYDAFGNLTGSSGTWSGPFGYAGGFGYQEDPDHGLRLLGHRYYDSSTGRFISKDPAGQGRNWNNYCSQNPLGAVDPNGLDHFVIVVGQGNYDEDILPSRFLELARKLENFLKGLGHTVKILLRPTIGTLEDQLATADGLVYVGHGSPGGWWITQKRGGMGKMLSLSPHKLKLILKGRKLKTIVAVTCNTFASDAMGKQWEECADKVFGFTGSAPHVSSFSEVFEDWVKKRSPKGPSRLPRRGGRGSPIMPGDFGWGKGG